MPKKRSILLLLLLALLCGAPVLLAQNADPLTSPGATPLPWLYLQVEGNSGTSGQVYISFYDGSGNYYWEPINYYPGDTTATVAANFAYWFQSDYGNALIAQTSNDVLMLQFTTAFSQSNQAIFDDVQSSLPGGVGFWVSSEGMVVPPKLASPPPASPNNPGVGQNGDGSITVGSATPAPNAADPSGGSYAGDTQITTTDGLQYIYIDSSGNSYILTAEQAAAVIAGGYGPNGPGPYYMYALDATTTSYGPPGGGGATVPNNPSQLPDPNNPSTPDPVQQVIAGLNSPYGVSITSHTVTGTDPASGCPIYTYTFSDGSTVGNIIHCTPSDGSCQ